MKAGKKIVLALMVVLALGQTSMVASAHGHHHSSSSKTYSRCTVSGCTAKKTHKHHGRTYRPCRTSRYHH